MLLSRGDPSIFLSRPISLGLLIACALMVALLLMPNFRRAREAATEA
jgi:TctA family transporter